MSLLSLIEIVLHLNLSAYTWLYTHSFSCKCCVFYIYRNVFEPEGPCWAYEYLDSLLAGIVSSELSGR